MKRDASEEAQKFRDWITAEDEAASRKGQLMKRLIELAGELRLAEDAGDQVETDRLSRELSRVSAEVRLL